MKENHSPKFKNVSSFTRWVNDLEKRDEASSSIKRRIRWILLVGALFFIFIWSLVQYPSSDFKHRRLKQSAEEADKQKAIAPIPSPFELPTDSFEILLKHQINENLSKTK